MKTKILISLLVTSLLFAGFGGQPTHAADDAPITIYVVPPITDEKILPTTDIPGSHISNEISIVASPGEYEPASFIIKALDDIASLEVEATELEGESDSIPSSNIDIRVVKCWYQADNLWGAPHKHFTPELLLKDDSLVKVEGGENYLKKLDGTYMWISDPTPVTGSDRYRPRTIDEIPVNDSLILQPVDIPINTNKQFWVTLKVPDDALPGIYTGNIELGTPDGVIGQLQISLEVLPIELLEPYLEYSIYYCEGSLSDSWPEGSISAKWKSEQQLRAELENLHKHGVTNPAIYQGEYQDPIDTVSLERFLAIMNEVGMGNQPLYYIGLGESGAEILDINKVPEILSIAQSYGFTEVYFYGIDEALWSGGIPADEAIAILLSQRPTWEEVHALGGKIFAAGVPVDYFSQDDRREGEFGFVGDLLDLLICYSPTPKANAEEAARWHSVGHRIFAYGNPQVGEEKPETYRRNYGLLLWQWDFDGAMDFAYSYGWGNIWNDLDSTKSRCFTYPTIDGVVDTIQWEGWREGVDDVRYLTTLLEAIEVGRAEGRDTSVAEAWLADLKSSDLAGKNLDSVRSEMIDYILSLQNEPGNQPPVLNPIGDKLVNEGELVEFAISGTDPDGDVLTYSASNLPQGASFDPQTQTFSWSPDEAGVYPNIHFEVSDGSLTDSEDITITVNQLYEDWDVNGDEAVNVLDMILVGQHWDEVGPAGWIQEDVNEDGTVNVLDVILIGQHWTG